MHLSIISQVTWEMNMDTFLNDSTGIINQTDATKPRGVWVSRAANVEGVIVAFDSLLL